MKRSVYIGYDRRETDAYSVARRSLMGHRLPERGNPIPVRMLSLPELQKSGIYTRPTLRQGNRLIDGPSVRPDYNGNMSTEFAISRFFVPHLAKEGWALFMDCDMLVRRDIGELFALADPSKALMCVQHDYQPSKREKMDGQIQTPYPRKNWSSLMLFNCDHPANKALTLELLNTAPGYQLHQFCWLRDADIGALPQDWNMLIGECELMPDPAIAHFTLGTPDLAGYESQPFADEWRAELAQC